MAIDSLNKRASCIGIDLNWVHVFPKPGTTVNAQYRAQIGMKYAGDLSGAAPPAAVTPYRMLMGIGA